MTDEGAKNLVAIGLHQTYAETPAKCNETYTLTYPYSLSMVMGDVSVSKRPYLCRDNFDEGYMGFDCLSPEEMPKEGDEWYKLCRFLFSLSLVSSYFSLFVHCATPLFFFLN